MNFAQESSSAQNHSPDIPSMRLSLRPIKYSATPLESALLQVFILNDFNFTRINTYEKPGEGGPIMVNQIRLTKRPPISRAVEGKSEKRAGLRVGDWEHGRRQSGAEEGQRLCVVYN